MSAATPARRGVADLPLSWANEAELKRLDAALGGASQRAAALKAFNSLPTEANLLFTGYVDLRSADLEGSTLLVPPVVISELPASDLPAGAAALISISARGVGLHLGAEARAAGLTVGPLPGGTPLAGAESDRMTALIGACWNSGTEISLPSGSITAPIIIRIESPAQGEALLARIAVKLGENVSATISEEVTGRSADSGSTSGTTARALLATTSEVTLGKGAKLRLASIQELPEGVVYLPVRRHEFGANAELQIAAAQIGARLVRGRIDHQLTGNGSKVRQVEVVFAGADQLHDLTTYSLHAGEKTVGDLLAKGIFAGKARGFVKGVTTIPRSGRGTNSYLGEFGMLLSKTARSVAIPSLWIDQPDCERAAHGSSVGPIDPNQIFYLRARGLTEAEARRTIVMGYLEPVVAALPLEEEADRLREVLAAKLDAAFAAQLAAAATAA
ncbi:MAG: SufD family Fe-S cluster assembly protein [Candidatus Limnocylindrus sp. ZSMar2m-chloro-G89]|nr:MAG: SufD family Fe-S cluster assembly protein [Candidatus Limnocylindrus sp. ZSMar2m-chloro-G89]